MKIGAVYPTNELAGSPEAFDQIGRAVEALGYEHVVLYDHVVGAVHENRDPPMWEHGPYTDQHPFHEPFVALGYLAGITRRIELVIGVLVMPQRQTVLVAKQAAEVDLLSGGRLRLGVGSGWNYVEYDALGEDFATRGPRLSEQIPYLRRLWEEPLVTFEGRFDRIDRASILPRPRRRIPIYCGGMSEPAYKRAAKLADGFLFGGSIDHALRGWERLRQLLVEEGRSVAGFGAHYMAQDLRGQGLDAQAALVALTRWRDAGGTDGSVVTMGQGLRTAQAHVDHLEKVRRLVEAL